MTPPKKHKQKQTPNTGPGPKMKAMAMEKAKMKADFTRIDVADLPHDDDGEWLHRLQDEEAEWTSYDEQEKAVSDKSISASTKKPVFSKVFGLGTSRAGTDCVSIPADYKPSRGSPSSCLQSDPNRLRDPILATARLMVKFIESGQTKGHYSTAFAVSPTILLSAKHSLDKPNIIDIRACQGHTVLPHNFIQQEAWKGKVRAVSRPGCSNERDENGLFVSGADVGMIMIPADLKTFLLPCSPTVLTSAQRKRIAIMSFPAVDGFLKEAKRELMKGKNGGLAPVWRQYLPVMATIFEKEIRLLAKKNQMSVRDLKATKTLVEQVEKLVKERLYNELVNTFAFTHTGTMVCSVGSIACCNAVSIGIACSTLRGSSGAPICSMDRPGNFIGVHHGGSPGFDFNSATSCDNIGFVKLYMKIVLPTLPDPKDTCWSSKDMEGFDRWLHLHAAEISSSSPWFPRARRALKRKR